MKKSKILITGANGQLGSEFKELETVNDQYNFIYTDVEDLDITDFLQVSNFIIKNEVDIIVNCAAYTNVDKSEDDIDLAYKINAIGPEVLSNCAFANKCKLIHISTDYVFDGNANIPYKETDSTNPIGIYSKTKYQGECAVLSSGAEAIIIRTSWLYSSYGNNFVKTMIRLGTERNDLGVVSDQIGTPTYANDLAKAIIRILETKGKLNNKNSVYHFSNLGVASWFDFAVEIMKTANIECNVKPIASNDYPTKATRPHFSVLDKSLIIRDFDIEIPYWRTSLIDCINKIDNNHNQNKSGNCAIL